MIKKVIAINHTVSGRTDIKFYGSLKEAIHDPTFLFDEIYWLVKVEDEEMKK